MSLVGWTLDGYFQHQRLLVALIDEKEAAYCHLLLMSYACYPLYYFLQNFQYVTVDGFNFNWTKWNNCWSILFWSFYCRACCNFLDSGFCALCVVLQWEYKFFAVLSELHTVFIKLWIPDGATFWWLLHFLFVGNDWIPVKIFGVYDKWVQKFLHIFVLTLLLWTSYIPMFNSVSSGSVRPRYHQAKVEAVADVPAIEIGRRSLIHLP